MQTKNDIQNYRSRVSILVLSAILAPELQAEDSCIQGSSNQVLSQKCSVSMIIKNKTLLGIAHEITERTGIRFKFDANVESDLIDKELDAPNWSRAIDQLLQHYNYTMTQTGDSIRSVFVTGYRGGAKRQQESLHISPTHADVYQRRETLENRAITIAIPTDALVNLPEGGNIEIDLPIGSFNINQDSQVTFENGMLSWVGTIDKKNKFHRLYLTRDLNGDIVGNVFTPERTYNILTVDGQTVMIEVKQLGMR